MYYCKRSLGLVACALLLAGCVQVRTLLTLNPDGSGMLELILQPTADTLELLRAMSESDKIFMDESELRAYADSLGEGVSYMSHKIIEDGDGIHVWYRFTDVAQVKAHLASPADLIAPEGVTSSSSNTDFITFGFAPGTPARLHIHMPPAPETAETAVLSEEERTEGERQLQALLADARITFEVALQGRIQETNAAHRQAATVTLADLDFNRLLQDKELVRRMAEHPHGPPPDFMAQLAEKGFTFEAQPEIEVVFE